mgnify:CR=1 FL=1
MRAMRKWIRCLALVLACITAFQCTDAMAATVYGTKDGRTYYSTVSGTKKVRVEKTGSKIGKKDTLEKWIEGYIDSSVRRNNFC